jgi:hypothetical protein
VKLALPTLAVAAALLAPAPAGASPARTPVSLVASPARVTIAGSGRATVTVTNSGSRRVEIEVRRAGFALDLRGRPRIVRRARGGGAATPWLIVRPRRLAIRPGAHAALSIGSRVPRNARPGDHDALVVLTTRPIRGAKVAVRMRLGVMVVVRAPGRTSRRMELRRLRVRRVGRARVLELMVANRGDVIEILGPKRLTLILQRGDRVVARLDPVPRQLLPRTKGLVQARYAGRVRGRVTAIVGLSSESGGGFVRRTYHLRL